METFCFGPLEIWVESRARPVAKAEIVLGVRNIGRVATDWVTELHGQVEVSKKSNREEKADSEREQKSGREEKPDSAREEKADSEEKPFLLSFEVPSVAPQEKGVISLSVPDQVVSGEYQIRLVSVRWISSGRRHKEKPSDAVWEMEFFEEPSREIPPFTLEPLKNNGFQDPFEGSQDLMISCKSVVRVGSLKDLIECWKNEHVDKKALGLYGEVGSGKTTLLHRIQTKRGGILLSKGVSLEKIENDRIVLLDEPDEEDLETLGNSGHRFVYTAHIRRIRWAPEWALAVRIPWLSGQAVERLIAMSPVKMDRSVGEEVVQWSGGHPLLTQILLSTLSLGKWNEGFVTSEDMLVIGWQTIESYWPHLQRMWDAFSKREQAVLVALSKWHTRRGERPLLSDVIVELERTLSPGALALDEVFPGFAALALTKGPEVASIEMEKCAERIEYLRDTFIEAQPQFRESGLLIDEGGKFVDALSRVMEILYRTARRLRGESFWLALMPGKLREYRLKMEENVVRERIREEWRQVSQAVPHIETALHRYNGRESVPSVVVRLEQQLSDLGLIPTHWVEMTIQDLVWRGWVKQKEGYVYIYPLLLERWIRAGKEKNLKTNTL